MDPPNKKPQTKYTEQKINKTLNISSSCLCYSGLYKGTYVWMFWILGASEILSVSPRAAKGRAETRARGSRKIFDLIATIISSSAAET